MKNDICISFQSSHVSKNLVASQRDILSGRKGGDGGGGDSGYDGYGGVGGGEHDGCGGGHILTDSVVFGCVVVVVAFSLSVISESINYAFCCIFCPLFIRGAPV